MEREIRTKTFSVNTRMKETLTEKNDYLMAYSDVIEEFDLKIDTEEERTLCERLFRRCYGDRGIIGDLIMDAKEVGCLDLLMKNAPFVVFRGKNENVLLGQYLKYKYPMKAEEEIDNYVMKLNESELDEWFNQIEFMRTPSNNYIISWDFMGEIE